MRTILAIPLGRSTDRLVASRRTRDLAVLLGLGDRAQTQLAGAVAEVVEGATTMASDGSLGFSIDETPDARSLFITVTGLGPAALASDETPGSLDLARLRTLVDHVETRTNGAIALVRLTWHLDGDGFFPPPDDIVRTLQAEPEAAQVASMDELRRRNAELVQTLSALQARERELLELNRQLEDTNAGIVGLLQELDQTSAELRLQASSTTRFLRTVSHELRTPLYAARGLLEELAMAEGLDSQARADVKLLDGTVEEALSLVNDQLDLARVEAGRSVVRVGAVDVAEIFGRLRGTLRVLRRSENVDLTFEGEDTTVDLCTNAVGLTRILRNLVGNALKFTEHGAVHVSATTVQDGDAVAFVVSDTGIGIAAEDLPRIFEDFEQVDAAQDHGFASTGLGLPLAKRLTVMLGGTLEATSTPGVGSTFTVTIPTHFLPPADLHGIEAVQT
ncbi:MAG: histidine kinase [Solirubrobacterales bacterium]|nr:histidine kinase [Solirubrobacterales bacterium]